MKIGPGIMSEVDTIRCVGKATECGIKNVYLFFKTVQSIKKNITTKRNQGRDKKKEQGVVA